MKLARYVLSQIQVKESIARTKKVSGLNHPAS